MAPTRHLLYGRLANSPQTRLPILLLSSNPYNRALWVAKVAGEATMGDPTNLSQRQA